MSHYKHLTLIERESILYFYAKGYTITEISKELGRNKSTISRELRRNSEKCGYIPVRAQEGYEERRKRSRRKKLLSDNGLYELVKDKFLGHQWSPEQISGRLKLEGSPYSISCSTIYRAIYSGMFDTPEQKRSEGNRGARRKLRHRGKPRHKAGDNDGRRNMNVSRTIRERPEEAGRRQRLGDWEADTVLGKSGGACLVTLVDRKSRYLICRKAENKTSGAVVKAMIKALNGQVLNTVTPDMGREFQHYEEVEKALGAEFYFALPHSPWQRGTNENTNGLLREYFPKSSDITNISEEYIQCKEDELNLRPRKVLGFFSPLEVHFSKLLHLT